jgi:universal stress protein A
MSTQMRHKIMNNRTSRQNVQDRARNKRRVQESAMPRGILVPVDFSPESTKALKYASEAAGKRGTEVTLLHVVAPIHYVHDFGYGPVRRQRTNDFALKKARGRLRALGRWHIATAHPWTALVRSGTTCKQIAKAAQELKVEMIVMPTRGLMPADQDPTGSMAARVIRQAPCPVLTLPKPLRTPKRRK